MQYRVSGVCAILHWQVQVLVNGSAEIIWYFVTRQHQPYSSIDGFRKHTEKTSRNLILLQTQTSDTFTCPPHKQPQRASAKILLLHGVICALCSVVCIISKRCARDRWATEREGESKMFYTQGKHYSINHLYSQFNGWNVVGVFLLSIESVWVCAGRRQPAHTTTYPNNIQWKANKCAWYTCVNEQTNVPNTTVHNIFEQKKRNKQTINVSRNFDQGIFHSNTH